MPPADGWRIGWGCRSNSIFPVTVPKAIIQAPSLEAFRRQVRLMEFNIAAEVATARETAALRDPYHVARRAAGSCVSCAGSSPVSWPATHFRERRYRFDPEVMELSAPRFLSGFWQSEKYFIDVADLIRRELTPRDPTILDYTRRYVADHRASAGGPVVSVHLRRGELAYAQDVLRNTRGTFGPPTSLEYIRQAIARFEPGCQFLVFSDSAKDIAWCKGNLQGERLNFSEGHDDVQDMMLISACDHHIIASTFSWWAAWLDARPDRRVIAPRQWGHPGSEMTPEDLIPARWEMI